MSVAVSGLDATRERLAGMAARLRDLTPVMTVAAADTATLIDDSFAESRSPDGSPFAPLAEATIARRRGGSATPLVDTGRLRASIFARGGPAGLVFGTNTPYAPPHQTGTRRIPRRAFLPVNGVSAFTLMTAGPAGTHWQRVRSMVLAYIRTGALT